MSHQYLDRFTLELLAEYGAAPSTPLQLEQQGQQVEPRISHVKNLHRAACLIVSAYNAIFHIE